MSMPLPAPATAWDYEGRERAHDRRGHRSRRFSSFAFRTRIHVCILSCFKGKKEADCDMEGHHDYIDIQIPMNADEVMGWKAQVDCEIVKEEYDEGKDMELYGDKAVTFITVPAGYFVVFFPSDAHQPGIAPGKSYRKLIVKTRVEN